MALLVGAHTSSNTFSNRTFSLTNKLANYINEKEQFFDQVSAIQVYEDSFKFSLSLLCGKKVLLQCDFKK